MPQELAPRTGWISCQPCSAGGNWLELAGTTECQYSNSDAKKNSDAQLVGFRDKDVEALDVPV